MTVPELDTAPAVASTRVEAAIARTRAFLAATRRENGTWAGELSSSALATAMSMVALRRHYGEQLAERLCAAADWLAATQHPEGSWGDGVTDNGTINSTALAVAALYQHDAARYDEAIRRGKRWLEAIGGFAAINNPAIATLSGPCRTVWAHVGLVPWPKIKSLPVEISLLPKPIQRTISTTFPAFLSLSMLHDRYRPVAAVRRPLRRLCERRGIRWLRQAQCSNGGFEESAFLTSVVAFCLIETAGKDVAARAAAYVAAHQRADGSWPIDRDLETFDSALTVQALATAGEPLDSPADQRLLAWFRATQFREVCFPTGAQPGGWAWAQPGGWPDMDDTSATLRAVLRLDLTADPHPGLAALGHPSPQGRGAGVRVQAAIAFTRWMQNRDGSWSTFVKNSPMPFDRSCPYITGHVLSSLAESGLSANDPSVAAALRFLGRVQNVDGSFDAIWFRNHVAGTASVLEALTLLGLGGTPMATRAANWLCRAQRPDGGWTGTTATKSSAEETAWAAHALLLHGAHAYHATVARGIDWLIDTQRSDGQWEHQVIGLYYSTLWYSDSMLAVALPLQALESYRRMTRGET